MIPILILASILIQLTISSNSVFAQENSSEITSTATMQSFQLDNDLIFIPVSILSLEEVNGESANNGRFLTILGILLNTSDRSRCIYANDLVLSIDNVEYSVATNIMGDIQNIFDESLDYIGGFLGHCVSRNEQENTFVTFDVPDTGIEFTLQVDNDIEQIVLDWDSLATQNITEFTRLSDLSVTVTQNSIVATQTATLWTPTSTLSPSLTPTITNTPTQTYTPLPTELPTLTDTPQPTNLPSGTIYYVTAQANVRSCPQTSCDRVVALSFGDEIEILDNDVEGEDVLSGTRWMQGVLNEEIIYIHSDLVSRNRPSTIVPASSNNTSSSGNTSNTANQSIAPTQVVAPPVSSACNCNQGNTLNCSDFSRQSQAQACHNQCVSEVGRDVHGLDGNDNDGLACESLP